MDDPIWCDLPCSDRLAGARARGPGAGPSYPLGPLVPPEFAAPPASVPPGPMGEYPEDWAECVQDNPPPPQQYPRDLDLRAADAAAPNPLVGTKYFVDRMEPAYMQWARWKRSGEYNKADTIWKLAREPRFRWFGRFTRPRMQKKVRGFLDRVQCDQPGSVPLMVVMRHQGRACSGGYLAGGVAEDRRTMKWYEDFAEAVGDARVVIAFEPDSLGTLDCLALHRRDDRLRMLRHGVDVLVRAAERHRLPRGRRLGLGARHAHRQAAAQHRHRQGARVHAQRDPPRLDALQHPARPGDLAPDGRQALHRQHELQRPRAGPLPQVDQPDRHIWRRINVWCHPGLRGLGPPPTTATSRLERRRVHVHQPPRLLGRSLQRRADSRSAPGGQTAA